MPILELLKLLPEIVVPVLMEIFKGLFGTDKPLERVTDEVCGQPLSDDERAGADLIDSVFPIDTIRP